MTDRETLAAVPTMMLQPTPSPATNTGRRTMDDLKPCNCPYRAHYNAAANTFETQDHTPECSVWLSGAAETAEEKQAATKVLIEKLKEEYSAAATIARHRTEATAALTAERDALAARVAELEAENERLWRERNIAYTKVKAWEASVYVEGMPLRAVRVEEWGPGEGEQTTVPDVTPKRLVDLLDRLATLERKALHDPKEAG